MVLPILDGVPVLAWLMSSYNGCGDGGGVKVMASSLPYLLVIT